MSRVPQPRRPLKRAAGGIPAPWERRVRQRTGAMAARVLLASGELKFLDTAVDETTVPTGGTIETSGTVNVIAQAVGDSGRVGRKVVVRSIGWRYNLLLDGTTVVSAMQDTVRLILYQDKQCNKATAAVTDILASANYQSFNNLNNKGRFLVLHDNVLTVNASAAFGNGTTNSSASASANGSFFKKVNIPIEFSGANGTIGEITSNNLAVLAISQTGNADLDSIVRLRFTDN